MTSGIARACLVCACLTWGVADAQKRPNAEAPPLIESVEGADLYGAYCAVCHGKDAKGGGPMAAALRAATPDLTGIAKRSGGKFPVERVRGIIAGEVELPQGHGTREMPVWGPVFSRVTWDRDLGPVRLRNLTAFLEKLQSK